MKDLSAISKENLALLARLNGASLFYFFDDNGWDIQKMLDQVPLLENPYTRILADVRSGERILDSKINDTSTGMRDLKDTPMGLGGHLVDLCGKAGHELTAKYSWTIIVQLIHYKAHPDMPAFFARDIPTEISLAYLEYAANLESKS